MDLIYNKYLEMKIVMRNFKIKKFNDEWKKRLSLYIIDNYTVYIREFDNEF
jgi:hypothetical protein